jgi:hypothetical protein
VIITSTPDPDSAQFWICPPFSTCADNKEVPCSFVEPRISDHQNVYIGKSKCKHRQSTYPDLTNLTYISLPDLWWLSLTCYYEFDNFSHFLTFWHSENWGSTQFTERWFCFQFRQLCSPKRAHLKFCTVGTRISNEHFCWKEKHFWVMRLMNTFYCLFVPIYSDGDVDGQINVEGPVLVCFNDWLYTSMAEYD